MLNFEDVFDDVDFEERTDELVSLLKAKLFLPRQESYFNARSDDFIKNLVYHFLRKRKRVNLYYLTQLANTKISRAYDLIEEIEIKLKQSVENFPEVEFSPFRSTDDLVAKLRRFVPHDRFDLSIMLIPDATVLTYIEDVNKFCIKENVTFSRLFWCK